MACATGYVHDLLKHPDMDLAAFAMRCARAFGACVTMRDDPDDALPPEKFEPSTYHKEALEKAKTALAQWEATPAKDRQATVDALNAEAAASHEQIKREWNDENLVMGSMLSRVKAWEVPEDISGLKAFMIQQLESSMNDLTYFDRYPEKGVTVESRLGSLKRDVDDHEKAWREENERVEDRNRWLAALRGALEVRVP